MAASAAREVATVATDIESINTDKEQTGLSVISDIELFLSTLCSLVELLPQISHVFLGQKVTKICQNYERKLYLQTIFLFD